MIKINDKVVVVSKCVRDGTDSSWIDYLYSSERLDCVEWSCIFHISAYCPPMASNSSCVPCSLMTPSRSTMILSAFLIVPSRWAMMSTVRSLPSRSKASFTDCSVIVSAQIKNNLKSVNYNLAADNHVMQEQQQQQHTYLKLMSLHRKCK